MLKVVHSLMENGHLQLERDVTSWGGGRQKSCNKAGILSVFCTFQIKFPPQLFAIYLFMNNTSHLTLGNCAITAVNSENKVIY